MKKLINKAKILVFGEAATGEKIVSPCGIRTVMPDRLLSFNAFMRVNKVSKATWGL